MAFSFGNNWCGGALTTTVSAMTVTSQNVATAGAAFLVMTIGFDNNTVTDLPSSDTVVNVTGGGLTWRKAVEWTNAQAATAAGATTAIWYAQPDTTDVTNSSLIIVSFSGLVSRPNINCIRFNRSAGAQVTLGAVTVMSVDGVSVGPLTLAGLSSQEYLFIAGLCGEETAGASFAEMANYTSGTRRGSGTNAATANGLRTAYRILTATTDTYDPATIATDWSEVYVAFYEKTPVTTVSLTAGLDAALLKALTTTTTIDAALKKALTLALGADAVLARTMQALLGIDAVLQGTGNLSTGLQAVLQKQFALQASIEVVLQKTLSLNLGLDASLQEQMSLQASIDAALAKEILIQCGLDAQLIALAVMARTVAMDALLAGTWRTSAATSGTWAAATPAT